MYKHPTFNVELNDTRLDGLNTVSIRITKERKHRRIATEMNVRTGDFNKKARYGNWVRATEPRNKAYNDTLDDTIRQYKAKYSALLAKGTQPSLDELVANLTSNHSPSFISFYKQEIIRYEKNGQFRTSEKHQFILNKLEHYLQTKLNRADLNFNELNVPFLTAYETYLRDSLGNHQNTHYTDLKNIRTIYRNAIQQEVVEQHTYPFFRYRLHQIPTVKEKLTTPEIDNIRRLKLVEGKATWHARNCFLFSYYCSGMRFGDVCTLKWANITDDKRVQYIMSKNNKGVNLKLPQQALDILEHYRPARVTDDDDYIFPLLKNGRDYSNVKVLKKAISSKNTVIDRELKNIAALAKIRTKLTFHISRHSFAVHVYQETKDVKLIQDALFHSSLNETQKYLKELGVTELDTKLDAFYNKQGMVRIDETLPKLFR